MSTLRQGMLTGSAIAALLLYAVPANATVVTTGSGPVNVAWSDAVSGGGVSTTLTGTLQLTSFNFSGTNSVSFHVNVANTTTQGALSTGDWQSIRLVSFGFNTDPDATTSTDNSTVFNTSVDNNQPLPSFGKLDFCAFQNNCAGGSSGGLTPNTGDSFDVTLSGFSSDITSLDLGIGAGELFAVKYQTAFGSFEFADGSGGPNPPPPPPPPPPGPIPEPGSLLLLGSMVGLAGGGLWWRRRQSLA